MREFDDVITAPNGGYLCAADYYERASAGRVVDRIAVPTLILTSQDDPFVPFSMFDIPGVAANPYITLLTAPKHGGHCSFISNQAGAERYWAEARVMEFCLQLSRERAKA